MIVRPMEPRDVDAVHEVSLRAFADLDRRAGQEPDPPSRLEDGRARLVHLLRTDPGGSWVGERDGVVTGCALGIVREGLWGLSLLVVDPAAQSAGLGRELLARAHAHGDGARGRVILASSDPRALRAYARLGLELQPAVRATGVPRGVPFPPAVRPGEPGDRPALAAVDRAVRGAAHGDDLDALLRPGSTLLVHPDRGYVVTMGGTVRLLAAGDEPAAVELLRAALATAGDGPATVDFVTAAQQWALRVCVEAGLELQLGSGAVFLDGDVGPFRPYLPSGAYL